MRGYFTRVWDDNKALEDSREWEEGQKKGE